MSDNTDLSTLLAFLLSSQPPAQATALLAVLAIARPAIGNFSRCLASNLQLLQDRLEAQNDDIAVLRREVDELRQTVAELRSTAEELQPVTH